MIYLTGSNGFIGKNFYKFSKHKKKIVLISRQNLKKKNYIKFDIGVDKDYRFVVKNSSLVHLAWDFIPFYNNHLHFNHFINQYKFLRSLILRGVKNIFIMGSCFEYGNLKGPLDETINCFPKNYYAISKLNLLNSLLLLQKKYDFNLTWGRLFYVYGKYQHKKSLFSQYIESARKKEIFYIDNPHVKRDYLSVKSVVEIIDHLIDKGLNFGLVNISSNKPISVIDQVKNWNLNFKTKVKIGFKVNPNISINEQNNFWGLNDKLKYILDNN